MPNETKVTQILTNFFRSVGPGSPIFFVLWGPDRQLFSFCGARIANFFQLLEMENLLAPISKMGMFLEMEVVDGPC